MSNRNTVCFTGMEAAEQERLAAMFAEANRRLGNRWSLAREGEAEVVIIDVDSLYGHMSWLKAHNSGRTVVAMSSSPQADADHVLLRPVTLDALAALLAGQEGAVPVQADAPVQAAASPDDGPRSDPPARPEPATRPDAARAPVRAATPDSAPVRAAPADVAPAPVQPAAPPRRVSAEQPAVPPRAVSAEQPAVSPRAVSSEQPAVPPRAVSSEQRAVPAAPKPATQATAPSAATPAAAAPAAPAPAAAPAPPREPRLIDYLQPGALPGPVKLSRGEAPMLVLDPTARVYFGGSSLKDFLPYTREPIAPAAWTVVPASELAKLKQELGGAQPFARLLWLAALTGGGGELAPGLDPNGRYKLVKWPQIEREFAKHFRIATTMMKGFLTVAEIAQQSGASSEDAADFINANLVTGYAEAESVPDGGDAAAVARGGLLGRLRGR